MLPLAAWQTALYRRRSNDEEIAMSPSPTYALGGLSLAAALGCTSIAADAAVVISKKPTQNMTCSGGVCSPTAADAILNVDDLAGMLAASDIRVVSDGNAVDVDVAAAFGWASANRLTLDSYRSITFKRAVTVAGPGGLTLTVNDGGSGGDYEFVKTGRVEFWDLTSSLVIGGSAYRLENKISRLARDIKHNPAGFYALAKSHNASKDGTYAQSPIPTTFTGRFDGLGNSISSLSINDPADSANVGLFANSTSGAVLRDLNVVDATISASGSNGSVGGLVGYNQGGSILGVAVSGTISAGASHDAGGLAGRSEGGPIVASSSTASVSGGGDIGGLVGSSDNELIEQSHATGPVTAVSGEVGGLAGSLSGAPGQGVYNSYATGQVTASGSTVAGGLIGMNGGQIYYSFATGNVSSGDGASVGGLIGFLFSGQFLIVYDYARGSVTGGSNASVGGFAGGSQAASIGSYATGAVLGGPGSLVGGFYGADIQTQNNSDDYWDIDTSGTDQGTANGNISGIQGLTTEQFLFKLPLGFDPAYWGQASNINNGYPYLLANPPPK
jgi:hypothetical protein